jgi:exopolyphosphatase/guanosine-5'-triphosphate,3'-diphosphate pyrophosphatase
VSPRSTTRRASKRLKAPPGAGGRSQERAAPRAVSRYEPQRFASIDNGSNAIRIKVIEATGPFETRVLYAQRFPVRLGHDVFQTGKLHPSKVREALRVYRVAERMARVHRVAPEAIRAVGTSAVRDARNGEEFCARVLRDTGIHLEAISGSEEARLVRAAMRRALDLSRRRAILFDLGGGSLEISVLVSEETRFSTSIEVGTVRVLEAFLQGGRSVTREQELMVQELIDRALLPILPDVRALAPNLAAGVGGNFEALAELCPSPDEQGPGIHCSRLDDLLEEMIRLSVAERRKRFNLRPDRADVIVPATYIIRRLSQVFDIRRIAAPGVGLREGLLYQLVAQHYGVWDYADEAAEVANAARALGRRYQYDEAHAEQTERFALKLFDDLTHLHQFGPAEREVLRVAALLHDVGNFISTDRHHRHTYYIVANSDLGGMPHDRRELVARVARFHRKSPPTTKHALVADLDRADRDRVMKLAALLRIADALDREHRRAVSDVRVTVERGKVQLRLSGSHDPQLELWTVSRKADLFQRVFGMPVEVIHRQV